MASLYGHDMLSFVPDFESYLGSAFKTALYLLTYGYRYPSGDAVASLGLFDRAAFETLSRYPDLPVTTSPPQSNAQSALLIYLNCLGRLHIRRADQDIQDGGNNEVVRTIGYISVAPEIMIEILDNFATATLVEERNLQRVRSALDALFAMGELSQVLEQVIDHVKHVEAVGFYVGDRFLARMERFSNLISLEQGRTPGLLQVLRHKAYADWSMEEVLIVAALHALFLSGRSMRFEEFNGVSLTATALVNKLNGLLQNYASVGCDSEVPSDIDLFQLARIVFAQSLKAEGSTWLRYRWICGLNFQKTERLLRSTESTEDPLGYLSEFGQDFKELVGQIPSVGISEQEFFSELARAALDRDVRAVPFDKREFAAKGWFEFLIEKIVSSAVLATKADYGMSSSIRDVSRLLEPDEAKLLDVIHGLNNQDFFTCFVTNGFRDQMEKKLSDAIAQSVQRRMMYNRWHFIPGNLARRNIADTRHWFYPPVLPDLAIHSDVHHGGHVRARVKYSVRAPGPDMSMSPLLIANRPYRGFYDVRVVRMAGREFTTDDLLRARHRTKWLEPLYSVLVEYLTRTGCRVPVTGFQPGNYYDIESRRTHAV
ncbi:MAG TPA: hypothetical protein VK582_17065 [Pyrinomonadaceae bacterium]|nr:hypothetical protein [Pyrinomonadaceae bacterium]